MSKTSSKRDQFLELAVDNIGYKRETKMSWYLQTKGGMWSFWPKAVCKFDSENMVLTVPQWLWEDRLSCVIRSIDDANEQ